MDVILEGVMEKAVATASSGDLEIEGWVAKFNEPDRQNEYFMPNAFDRALQAVKDGSVPLLYQHQDGRQLGQVVDLEKRPEGVWGRAIVAKPVDDWAKDVYDKIKRRMMRGLSAKGMFTKQMLAGGGARIGDVDLYEVSATPVPVGGGATIEAVAEKALSLADDDELILAYLEDRFGEMSEAWGRLG